MSTDKHHSTWQDYVTMTIYLVLVWAVLTGVDSRWIRSGLLILLGWAITYHVIAMYRGET